MKRKTLKRYYWIIAVICLCFLIAGISFTIYMGVQNKKNNIDYFTETVEGMELTVSNLIKSNIETLDGVAVTIGSMEVIDLEHLLPIIHEINDRNAFYRMGFVDAQGKGSMVDLDGTIHEAADFSDAFFYQKAMRGEAAVSYTVKDSYSDSYLNYYGVPVVMKGETVGVLTAADETERLREVLDTSMFSSSGFSNIIDREGNYIIRSIKSPEITHISDISALTAQQTEDMLESLKNGEEDFIEYDDDGNTTWAVYIPLRVEDWYVLGIAQEATVNSGADSILGMAILIAAAMFIFSFLAYCMNQMQMRNERRLEELAYIDPLLKINNFVKFSMDAQAALKHHEFHKVAYWYGDIDDFKIFNETFGYEAGDQLLIDLAKVLKELSAKHDFFCRENADHFVGMKQYQSKQDLIDWYRELSDRLEAYVTRERKSFRLVMSIGFYCAESSDGILTLNEMYNRARMAQKSAKQMKNIKYAFYADNIRKRILHDNMIEASMKEALDNGCFKVFIQPKTAILDNNRIAGGEALVRWADPEKGMINPGEFIPLFEKNGFIIPLDRFMFTSVCKWLHDYLEEGYRPIRLAVNVSRLGIFQEDFLSFYAETKKKYQIPEGLLERECTESLAVKDNDLLCSRIEALNKEGFVCSLDDFGSGYSSLNTLKDIPIQVLKLDILFFRSKTDMARSRIIVENVIRMAKQLNIRIVAEGVEEVEQVEFLQSCGCDIVQGYVFGKPMPAEKFKALLMEDPSGDWGAGYKQVK